MALAAGYIAATAIARGAAAPSEIAVIPPAVARFAGDAGILDWIRASGAGVVGFGSYLWNLHRNLHLAKRIKERNPSTTVLMGGPEIVDGQPVLESREVDAFVIGEGESAFIDALRDISEGKSLRRVYRGDALEDLSRIPNPYLSGTVERERDDPVYLETMRGCPYACAFCAYGKSGSRLRSFPPARLGEIFRWAEGRGVPEIYLMDPSFNSTPRWEETLSEIARRNRTGIPLHTEIRLESITPQRAALFKAAGFKSVEVGLQSTNEKALGAVGRSWRRESFVRGAGLLREAGITVKTGIILGLPHDTPEDFQATVDFLDAHDLAGAMEIYPLSVLPGTRLKDDAGALGIRSMLFPPYWVLSTPTMSEIDLIESIRWVEQAQGIEFFPPLVPRFDDPYPGCLGFLDLRPRGMIEKAPEGFGRPANALTLLLDGAQLRDLSRLKGLGDRLLRENPFTLFRIVIASDDELDGTDMEDLAEAFHFPAHHVNLMHYFSDDPQPRFSVRLYRLTSRIETAERALSAGEPWEPIVRFSPELLTRGRALLSELPFLLVEGVLAPEDERALSSIYQGHEELVIRPGSPTGLVSEGSATVRR